MWQWQRNRSPNLELPLTYFHRSLHVQQLHVTTSQMQPHRYRSISWSWKSRENRSYTTAAYKKWMKSSITIAASSVCKHEILTDRLNKIQLRTVWCSINFYFCSKQTMNVFFHCTFTWICVDFSCKTAFIVRYHVMGVFKCCCLLFD